MDIFGHQRGASTGTAKHAVGHDSIGFFLFLVLIAGLAKSDAPLVEKNSVLVINIGQSFQEQKMESPLATFSSTVALVS